MNNLTPNPLQVTLVPEEVPAAAAAPAVEAAPAIEAAPQTETVAPAEATTVGSEAAPNL